MVSGFSLSAPQGSKRSQSKGATVRAGFTLIELLVVIAIIAILAAILFPVFAQAREKARQAACLSNCKQMALAVQQYTQDYDELLPISGDNAQCRGRWQWQIFPYVKNEQVFTCPNISGNQWSSKTAAANTLNAACGTNQVSAADISGYGWNIALGYDTRGYTYPANPGYSIADIKKPSETIMIGDVSYEGEAGYAMYAQNPALAGTGGRNVWYFPNFRHNTGKNRVLYFRSGGEKRTKPFSAAGRWACQLCVFGRTREIAERWDGLPRIRKTQAVRTKKTVLHWTQRPPPEKIATTKATIPCGTSTKSCGSLRLT